MLRTPFDLGTLLTPARVLGLACALLTCVSATPARAVDLLWCPVEVSEGPVASDLLLREALEARGRMVVRCDSLAHPLANTEFLFPFTGVVEVPPDRLVESLGPSLVVTALTRDPALRDALIRSPHIERLNLGPVPTSHVDWDQPHEGNLFEFLSVRRAIARAEAW